MKTGNFNAFFREKCLTKNIPTYLLFFFLPIFPVKNMLVGPSAPPIIATETGFFLVIHIAAPIATPVEIIPTPVNSKIMYFFIIIFPKFSLHRQFPFYHTCLQKKSRRPHPFPDVCRQPFSYFKFVSTSDNCPYVLIPKLPSDLAYHVRYRCPAISGFIPHGFIYTSPGTVFSLHCSG